MSRLFTPLALRGITARNRIFMSPMCQYSCAADGLATTWHLVHYGGRAAGGAGLVMVEATAVSPEGRISPQDCGIWNDEQTRAFAPITYFIRQQGAVAALQLAHAGRKAATAHPCRGGGPLAAGEGGWQPVAPSPLPFAADYPVPSQLTEAELERIEADFAAAARRARTAGFEVVEVHMAHGYLLHQFLSPLSNRRTDDYGGSPDNRLRFPLRVARAVREAWPAELPVFVRISATDWVEGGWDLPQSLELCRRLRECGIDLVDCSTGGLVPDAVIPAAPGFQVPFAAAVRQQVGIATGAVGLITDAEQAEQIIADGQADAVLLGRELLRSPSWPLQAAKRLGSETAWPEQYLRAR
ncbi:NADH:flavin oxidoreductase/NADH oxidase [Trichlorobacter ammonificans]|uniref:NADPH dehydrogenase n=1 Tax=Trichlorobacter ammonificans TaxID=2916410 RepID=A0ABN8HM80_9BACT|nr:NADH:flavin oxidoreductase/NADH oxidase [Trichlorobacter ammonificans]CAH2032140.1 NADPH dehydrogenase [Trichlorobacter ammonificans]